VAGYPLYFLGVSSYIYNMENNAVMFDPDDRKDQICTECGVGRYQETSIHDDWDGVLHCTVKKCNHEVKRYKSDDNPPPKPEEPQLSPTNEELYELQENLWNTYKTLGYQGEEFMYEHSFGFALDDFARAVLAKWGQS
jgi:hypothetical protein